MHASFFFFFKLSHFQRAWPPFSTESGSLCFGVLMQKTRPFLAATSGSPGLKQKGKHKALLALVPLSLSQLASLVLGGFS